MTSNGNLARNISDVNADIINHSLSEVVFEVIFNNLTESFLYKTIHVVASKLMLTTCTLEITF